MTAPAHRPAQAPRGAACGEPSRAGDPRPDPPEARHHAAQGAPGGPAAGLPDCSENGAAIDLDGNRAARRLARIAALHAQLAQVYRSLAEDAEKELAVLRGRALMDPVASPTSTAPAPAHGPSRLLTVDDVADLLQVAPKTIRGWREQGKLPPAVEIGGVIRWRPEDVDAWLAERAREAS